MFLGVGVVSQSKPPEEVTAAAAMLADLQLRPNDRVLVMLPDGPGFSEVIIGVIQQGALPLPVNPQLASCDVGTVVAEAAADVVLTSGDRIHLLVELNAEPPVLVEGSQGTWAALWLR